MKQLLYVGRFYPWNDAHDDKLRDALSSFDKVTIAVSSDTLKPLKGQPTKILDKEMKDRIKIIYFKSLTKFLNAKKEYSYILFER